MEQLTRLKSQVTLLNVSAWSAHAACARNRTQHSVDAVARWLSPRLGAQATSTYVPWITKR
eukprot:1800455-Alexandrium_andersonii.AAC.1